MEKRDRAKKAPLLIPNAITSIGLLFGLLVIFKMTMVEPGMSTYANIYSAALLLLVSAVADFADGLVARFLRSQSQFGLIFDSLNDAITFGVAPVVIVLKTLSPEAKTLFSFWATSAAMIYCLCGVLRLVRYSTQKPSFFHSHASKNSNSKHLQDLEKEKVGVGESSDRWRYFTGLPIPVACMALVSLTLFLSSDYAMLGFGDIESMRAKMLILSQFFLGFLMISRWRFPSLSKLSLFSSLSYAKTLGLAFGGALFFYLFSIHFALALVSIVWLYILFSWGMCLFYWLIGQKHRAISPRVDWQQ